MHAGLAGLHSEMHGGLAEMQGGLAGLEVRRMREISANRVEALRWSFAFWIGQLVAMAGLLAFMLRGVRG